MTFFRVEVGDVAAYGATVETAIAALREGLRARHVHPDDMAAWLEDVRIIEARLGAAYYDGDEVVVVES